jgi:hypothetical protein
MNEGGLKSNDPIIDKTQNQTYQPIKVEEGNSLIQNQSNEREDTQEMSSSDKMILP